MSLSVSYYTTNRTGGLYTNEHQKNEIERLWDYARTGSRTQRNGKDKQYYSLVIEACNRANDFLASHLVKSFTESVGYRQIFKNSNSCELPCTENDFYGYKRKALHEFDLLVKSVDL